MSSSVPQANQVSWVRADGLSNPRAQRIAKETWEGHETLIRQLYEHMTLDNLMDFMSTHHGFAPSKRQYVYKLESWNVRKYNPDRKRPRLSQDDNDGVPQRSPKRQRDDGVRLEDAGGEPPVFELTLDQHGRHGPTDYLSPISGSFNFSGNNNTEDPESPQRHCLPIPVSWGSSEQKKKRAADFLFALSDDGPAFRLYTDLYRLLRGAPDLASLTSRLSIIACARSAENEKHATTARNLLSQHLGNLLGSPTSFIFRMLEAYTYHRSEQQHSKDLAFDLMYDTMASVLDERNGLLQLPTYHSSIDMITYLFLDYGLDKYIAKHTPVHGHTGGRNGQISIKEQILQQYVNKQPLVAGPKKGFDATNISLRNCLEWCREQLLRTPGIPPAILSLPHDERHIRWREDIGLLCCLWSCWQGSYTGDNPSWTRTAETELALSPEELLSTVSSLIMDYGAGRGVSANRRFTPRADVQVNLDLASGGTLIERAYHGAQLLSSLGEEALWEEFLRKFLWLNGLIKISDEQRRFKSAAMVQVREFVESTLHIVIPTADAVDDDGPFQLDTLRLPDTSTDFPMTPALDFQDLQHLGHALHGGEENYSPLDGTGLHGALNMGQSFNGVTGIPNQMETVDLS